MAELLPILKDFGFPIALILGMFLGIDRYIRATASYLAPMVKDHFDAVKTMAANEQMHTVQLGKITDQLDHADEGHDERHKELKKLAESSLSISREILSLIRKDGQP